MQFEVRNRWTGAVMFSAEIECEADASEGVKIGLAVKWAVNTGANLARANLTDANLTDANLTDANLAGAYLARANLTDANLTDANLTDANLTDANLAGANLTGAILAGAAGIVPERTTPLLMLLDQPGKIRAYKIVDESGEGPFNGGIVYETGQAYAVDNADVDPTALCGAGINVATLDWCLAEWRSGYRILIVEFEAADIACIPTATDGKFRLHRCVVVAEKAIDPIALGLVVPPQEAEAAS